jgi:hypothetical protein
MLDYILHVLTVFRSAFLLVGYGINRDGIGAFVQLNLQLNCHVYAFR